MKTSLAGINLLRECEGEVLTAYLCPAKVWTIGIGHTGPDVTPGMKITKVQSTELLIKDLKWAEDVINSSVKIPLSQKQFDALVCLVYNIGSTQFKASSVLRYLNKRDYKNAAECFMRFNKARVNGKLTELKGLTIRRRKEKTLFLEGTK